MPREIPLIEASSVSPGGCTEVTAAGRIFAVCSVDGEIHVIDGICAHAGGPLAKGTLNGNVITCPWHGWQYDVTTGRHCLQERICQQRYEVRVTDGMLWVVLPVV